MKPITESTQKFCGRLSAACSRKLYKISACQVWVGRSKVMTNYKNVFNCCGEKNNTKPQTHTPLAPKLLGDLKVAGLEHTKLQLFVYRTQTAAEMA